MSTEQQPTDPAFDMLARGVQRCLWDLGWQELRPIQIDTIRAMNTSHDDLIIMAETAGGKTEAAFLPLLSQIADEPTGSIRIVYVGPLRALINDQFRRLEELCKHLNVPVHRWHGDVGAADRKRLVRDPGGVLLITPESIESLLVNRTAHLPALFGGLQAIVIDELHAFLDASRGLHLRSVLNRALAYVRPDEPRTRLVGLSATIGDVEVAKSFVNRASPDRVRIIADPSESKELLMRLHVYSGDGAGNAPSDSDCNHTTKKPQKPDERVISLRAIAADLVDHSVGRSNLVFCNAKGDIEMLADLSNETAKAEGLPSLFLVHHGSLSREIREDAEHRMQSDRPFTTICSSTMEMGVDIGSIHLVGQVGPPWSVSSMKQRLGRSGRRDDQPRRLRLYIIEDADSDATNPVDRLPLRLLQTVAVLDLMLQDRWLEPSQLPRMDLSTLTQQIVASIGEYGARMPGDLYEQLCRQGPFHQVETSVFADLLRCLASEDVIEQAPQGELILGLQGEHIRADRGFYAVFDTPIEYRLLHGARLLGTLPSAVVPAPDSHIVFAGRRWKVSAVDPDRREIHVQRAKGRKRPMFLGSPGSVHRVIRERMLKILLESSEFAFLDEQSQEMIQAGRKSATESGLGQRCVIPLGVKKSLVVTWTGTVEQRTLQAIFTSSGIDATDKDIAIQCSASAETVTRVLYDAVRHKPDAEDLARHAMAQAPQRKYDDLLSDELRAKSIGEDWLDLESGVDLGEACIGVQSAES
jgi:ATP-dependent helicase Lhr and Lhr-like helicase